jgi:hypothetical protein
VNRGLVDEASPAPEALGSRSSAFQIRIVVETHRCWHGTAMSRVGTRAREVEVRPSVGPERRASYGSRTLREREPRGRPPALLRNMQPDGNTVGGSGSRRDARVGAPGPPGRGVSRGSCGGADAGRVCGDVWWTPAGVDLLRLRLEEAGDGEWKPWVAPVAAGMCLQGAWLRSRDERDGPDAADTQVSPGVMAVDERRRWHDLRVESRASTRRWRHERETTAGTSSPLWSYEPEALVFGEPATGR